jgi:hypothetical protein
LRNLVNAVARPRKFSEKKHGRSVSVTDTGWEGFKRALTACGEADVSSGIEAMGRGHLILSRADASSTLPEVLARLKSLSTLELLVVLAEASAQANRAVPDLIQVITERLAQEQGVPVQDFQQIIQNLINSPQ